MSIVFPPVTDEMNASRFWATKIVSKRIHDVQEKVEGPRTKSEMSRKEERTSSNESDLTQGDTGQDGDSHPLSVQHASDISE